MPPLEFERKVNKFVELYRSIPTDHRLRGTDSDPRFDFMLNKHILADMYTAKTGVRLSRYSLKRVMEAALEKVA